MPKICFYFQVHQPERIKKYRVFDIGKKADYFNDSSDSSLNNKKIFDKVASKCYLPANALLLDLLKKHPEFKVSFSLSGIFLDQAERFNPEVIRSFKKLVDTGQVEILNETYYHSLSCLYSMPEFRRQVQLQKNKVKDLFGTTPKVFRNTELIYNNQIAYEVENLGYQGMLAEGADHVLGWRSPNFAYQAKGCKNLKLLLKNYKLSDDIAFRFSSPDWSGYPLVADKFASWINAIDDQQIVNLFMDYETFGEHQWADTGIFDFLSALPTQLLTHPGNSFVTPSEAVATMDSVGELDVPNCMSWADTERDLSAWLSNPMQQNALQKLHEIESLVFEIGDPQLIADWRKLTTSDHFYYMCTKWFADGDVHKYFNPYNSPYEAFISYMNVLVDLTLRAKNYQKAKTAKVQKFKKEARYA